MTGIPFKHNGRDYDGVDCLGIVYLYLKEQGIYFPKDDGKEIDEQWYNQSPRRLLKGLNKHFKKVKEPQANDILLFKLKGKLRHIGVMIDHHRFLHIRKGKRSSIERLSKWQTRLHSTYRSKEVTE